jgi:hypothetical protein
MDREAGKVVEGGQQSDRGWNRGGRGVCAQAHGNKILTKKNQLLIEFLNSNLRTKILRLHNADWRIFPKINAVNLNFYVKGLDY